MKATLAFHDGYVKIEYQHGGSRTRKSTGVAIPSKAYLKSNNEIKSSVTDFKTKQKIIDSFLDKAKTIITTHVNNSKAFPTGEQFKRAWDEYDKAIKESRYLLDYYDKFYRIKETEFSRKGFSANSIKDYRNIRFYLEDFITATKKPIFLDEINRDWMNKFVSFLETERKDFDKPKKHGGKYWSKGKLAGSTVKKRVALILGFINWLDDEKLYPMPKGLVKYYGTIQDSEAVKAIITKQEANNLYRHDFKNAKLNYIKDIFILGCFTGMRWEDICSFNERDVSDVEGLGLIIEKVAQKTGGVFRVPINKIVARIIQTYNYKFAKYSNANFNKYLKQLLKKTGWFDDETKFLDDKGNYKKRWQCISIHRGRDSFCTMLVNDRVPINEIMKYTGHASISSLNKYIDTNSQVKNFTNELVIE